MISQREWDEIVAIGFQRSYTNTASMLLSSFGDVNLGYPDEVPEFCAREGFLRIPRSIDQHHWYAMFAVMPVRAWLARAMPGSLDLLSDISEHHSSIKTVDEIVALLESHGRFKKLRHGKGISRIDRKYRKSRSEGRPGLDVIVGVRERDTRRNWKTVK